MTWARLDDRTSTSPEWVGLTDAALSHVVAVLGADASPLDIAEQARRRAQLAKAVHLVSLMWSVPARSDGKITPSGTEQICALGSFTVAEFHEGAMLLVQVGAWRRTKATPRDPMGAYEMRLGWAPGEQPTRKEDEDRLRRNALRDRLREGAKDYPIKLAAIERADGDCEYCGVHLGATSGQIDHVDPALFSNKLPNLAWVCAKCNKRKGMHPLDQVGMAFTAKALAARQISTRGTSRGPHVETPVDTVTARVGSGRVGRGSGRARVGKRQPHQESLSSSGSSK